MAAEHASASGEGAPAGPQLMQVPSLYHIFSPSLSVHMGLDSLCWACLLSAEKVFP